jgi:hypothetical protein
MGSYTENRNLAAMVKSALSEENSKYLNWLWIGLERSRKPWNINSDGISI